MARPRSWTDKDLLLAINEYHNNKNISVKKICEKYKIPYSSFMNNLDYKEEWRKKDRKRIHSFDIEAFKKDTHEKFYWLGFIAADGGIYKNTLRIGLKASDEQHLIKFNNFCKNEAPLTKSKNNLNVDVITATINSYKLVEYLAEYNIIQNKTFTFEIPVNKIPYEFQIDFCRGLIDGDGSVSINKKGNIFLFFCSANKKCVEQVKKILQIDNISINFHNNAYSIQKEGKCCISILDKLYKDSTENTRLDRKYNNYKAIKQS